MQNFSIRPMDAVVALHSAGNEELSVAMIASLSRAVFGGSTMEPARLGQRLFSRLSYRLLQCTTAERTRSDKTGEATAFHNPILERTGHPYARALLASSSGDLEALVEGGDPMNGPYMMIIPEVLQSSTALDRVFLNSVQGKDVQLRFICETLASYAAAKLRLERGESVRMKAVAAGTGLSLIVAYDRLIADGFDPDKITIQITDRDAVNTQKTRQILAKIPSTLRRASERETEGKISAETEDIFVEKSGESGSCQRGYDVVTAVGILEYFQGCTMVTTEKMLGLAELAESPSAGDLISRLSATTNFGGTLIINTYRPDASTRILELFGKRFDYRDRAKLRELMAMKNFGNARLIGSGNIYDLEVYEKI
ncbi:MAG: hypothetical protein WCI46_10550 [Verrucomicrobiota bacterium]